MTMLVHGKYKQFKNNTFRLMFVVLVTILETTFLSTGNTHCYAYNYVCIVIYPL